MVDLRRKKGRKHENLVRNLNEKKKIKGEMLEQFQDNVKSA